MEFRALPKPVPPHSLGLIQFRHPGYTQGNLLFSLPRVDHGVNGAFGVHHATAQTACAIVAANAFHGFLALDPAGTQRVDDPPDGILTATAYFFIVQDCTKAIAEDDTKVPYPVVASFRDWAFPHGQLPPAWAQAATRQTLQDGQAHQAICALTQFCLPVETAHLVPQHEFDWFSENDMREYILSQSIHGTANLLPLRRDIHTIFDQRRLVIVPKHPPSDSGSTSTAPMFVCHLLDGMDYYHIHNGLVQDICNGSAPFLFARFAWAILLRVKAFIVDGRSKHVQVSSIAENGQSTYMNKYMTGKDLRAAYSGGGTVGSTPLKRKRGSRDGEAVVNYGDDGDFNACDDDSDSDSNNGDCFWDDHRPKKSRRTQNSSEETVPDDMLPKLAENVETELRQAAAVIVNEVAAEDA